MSTYLSDGVLWFAVIAGSCYAYYKVPETLNHIRNLAACPEQSGPGPRKQLQKDAENAIGIDVLRTLSDSHSYDLRTATIKIVASRTIKSRAKRLLLRDLASRDPDRRQNAIYALRLLLNYPGLHGRQITDHFMDYDSFFALITALKNMISEHDYVRQSHLPPSTQKLYPEAKMPPSPVKVDRSQPELYLLEMLHALLSAARPESLLSDYPDNITCALSAGLVHRWLRHYPFPCAVPGNSKYGFNKSDVSNLFERRWKSDDTTMASILNSISVTPLGKKHLREAGLRGSSYIEIDDMEDTVRRWRHVPTRLNSVDMDSDVRMTNGESTAGAATPPPTAPDRRRASADGTTSRARSQEISREEEILRRRRREAVVVAEAGAPLSQENILQRTESGSVWRSFEQDVEPSPAEVDSIAELPSFPFGLESVGSPIVVHSTYADAGTDPWSPSSDGAAFLETERQPDRPTQPTQVEETPTRPSEGQMESEQGLGTDDFNHRINGVLDRIHQHREQARDSPSRQESSNGERRNSDGSVDTAPDSPASDEQAGALLSILRRAERGPHDERVSESGSDT